MDKSGTHTNSIVSTTLDYHYIGNSNLETLLNAIEVSPINLSQKCHLTKKNVVISCFSSDSNETSKLQHSSHSSVSCHHQQPRLGESNDDDKDQTPAAMSISSLIELEHSTPPTPPDTSLIFPGLSTTPTKLSPNPSPNSSPTQPTSISASSPTYSISFPCLQPSPPSNTFLSSFPLPSANQAVDNIYNTRNSSPSSVSNNCKRKIIDSFAVEKTRSKLRCFTEEPLTLNSTHSPSEDNGDELSILSSSSGMSSPRRTHCSHNNTFADNNTSNTCQSTTITCYHASVAQKSYGSEKRFLCPPPVVTLERHNVNYRGKYNTKPEVSISVVCETGERSLERKILLDENMKGTFKYLHVSGTAKAKQFTLKLKVFHKDSTVPYVVSDSSPVTIISKPSKKTAKARNMSSCILSGSHISLFNRINSQTVRTKYMFIEGDQLCAKGSSWSSFIITVVNHGTRTFSSVTTGTSPKGSNSPTFVNSPNSTLITYGSEITLSNPATGFTSDRLIIRKVEKGKIAQGACGPVSQMQKVALQSVRLGTREPHYLSATDPMNGAQSQEQCAANGASLFLGYQPSKVVHVQNIEFANESLRVTPAQSCINNTSFVAVEEVDDYLCWTIVGICMYSWHLEENSFFIYH
ncbi:7618_t:CDS:1 [Acaulospora colombiana]|uniref:7618_t:CDS:1 n=1 Tax=Acaulospora colombiana TaxID=27376 RepID=A0ACA9KUM6_9GLOM|nr:7618_t:CDS:1 [Acaulospora colombiana]